MSEVYQHPEYQALLAAVRAMPEDDLPRLVCADWLDEHNEPERAELIRVQCRIADLQRNPDDGVRKLAQTVGAFVRPEVVYAARVPDDLRRQQAELIALYGHDWGGKGILHSPPGVVQINREEDGDNRPVCEWWRGWPHTVRAPLSVLAGGECGRCSGTGNGFNFTPPTVRKGECPHCHGTGRTAGCLPRLVREQVVERVEVTDREPWDHRTNGSIVSWWPDDDGGLGESERMRASNLPLPVFDRLTGHIDVGPYRTQEKRYYTAAAAKAALSAAIIRWAESEGDQ